jgi:hypothetical protein
MPATDAPESVIEFAGVVAIVRVQNLSASTDYYVDVLGFKVDWCVVPHSLSTARGHENGDRLV